MCLTALSERYVLSVQVRTVRTSPARDGKTYTATSTTAEPVDRPTLAQAGIRARRLSREHVDTVIAHGPKVSESDTSPTVTGRIGSVRG